MEGRLPAHLEASAILRLAETHGGFATVLAKGEHDAGTILIVTVNRTGDMILFERMPTLKDTRPWGATRHASRADAQEFDQYLARRRAQDRDIWVLEVEIADPERFIDELPT